MRTLVIDIGGTGIKMLPVDNEGAPLGERHRELTPKPAHPEPVLAVIGKMLEKHDGCERVSVGFPGVVTRGIVRTAPVLGDDEWRDFDLAKAIADMAKVPARVINDADLQGYGVIEGRGVEMVLTLGTGLGTALYLDGSLVPNLELGHHPLKKKRTYQDLVADKELARIGKKRWRARVALVLETIDYVFNPDLIHIGGGNAKKLKPDFGPHIRIFTNVEALAGGIQLWQEPRIGAASDT